MQPNNVTNNPNEQFNNSAQQPQPQPQPQQAVANQNLNNNYQATNQNLNTPPNYTNQAQINPVQYNQPNNQQYVQNNSVKDKPNFGVIALIVLQIMYTMFSFTYMINMFSNNTSLVALKILVLILFIISTIGYAYLIFQIFLKKYWALMVYIGAMAVTATVEIKDVVAYNNLEWSYIASLIFSFTLLGLSVYLGTMNKKLFN